jgi:DNA-binding LytR/AlgR family response regulator
MKIMIVEDEPLVAMALAWEIESIGHQVIGPAPDAVTALQLLSEQQPDLVFLAIDLTHPGDGVEVAKELVTAGVPLVFASGQQLLATSNASLALGYVAKPYDPCELAAYIAPLYMLLTTGIRPLNVPKG